MTYDRDEFLQRLRNAIAYGSQAEGGEPDQFEEEERATSSWTLADASPADDVFTRITAAFQAPGDQQGQAALAPTPEASAAIALRARPYGQQVEIEFDLEEYTGPVDEQAVLAQWRERLDRLGLKPVGFHSVFERGESVRIDDVTWWVGPMGAIRHPRIPAPVFHRLRAAEADGIPFFSLQWAEEFANPTQRPSITAPGLEALIRKATIPRRADEIRPFTESPVVRSRPDPILFGVIKTEPRRGLWCAIGAWDH